MRTRQAIAGAGELFRFLRLHLHRGLRPPPAGRPLMGSPGTSGIVVTLTTLPGRIGRILPALNSLLDQTAPADRIYLALPPFSRRERKGYVIPEGLEKHPAVTLLPVERDWGPATKLIPVLRRYESAPDTPILAVDDDNVYPRTFLETFSRYANALPGAAFSLRGCSVPASRRWQDCREFKGSGIAVPVLTDIIEGCGGILVRPRFFGGDFFDYSRAPSEAFFVDDLWISGHLARRKIPRYVLPFPGAFVYLPSLTTFAGPALDRQENRSGRNNDVLIDYFREDWSA